MTAHRRQRLPVTGRRRHLRPGHAGRPLDVALQGPQRPCRMIARCAAPAVGAFDRQVLADARLEARRQLAHRRCCRGRSRCARALTALAPTPSNRMASTFGTCQIAHAAWPRRWAASTHRSASVTSRRPTGEGLSTAGQGVDAAVAAGRTGELLDLAGDDRGHVLLAFVERVLRRRRLSQPDGHADGGRDGRHGPSCEHRHLLPGIVGPLGVPLELLRVEVDLAQVAGGVALGLIVEVLRGDVAAQAAGGDGAGAHAVLAELDGGHEAVAARAVDASCCRCSCGRRTTPASPSAPRRSPPACSACRRL